MNKTYIAQQAREMMTGINQMCEYLDATVYGNKRFEADQAQSFLDAIEENVWNIKKEIRGKR